MIGSYTDDQLVIITTGSQGEPMSALTRMAAGDHRKVKITPNDFNYHICNSNTRK